jgi:hypothetical protein
MKRGAMLLGSFLVVGCGPAPEPTEESKSSAGSTASPTSKTGTSQADMALTVDYFCTAVVVGSGPAWGFQYNVWDYNDGSVMTGCSISNSYSQSTGLGMYRSTQNGAGTGSCSVTDDVDAPTSGYWSFAINRAGGTATATYHDTGSNSDGKVVALSCTKN